MQRAWTRTAQSNLGRYGSGLSALARRRAAIPRPRLRPGDAFTLFYSCMFATAAVVDAKVKDTRRRNLDDAIKDVKEKLLALDIQEATELGSALKAANGSGYSLKGVPRLSIPGWDITQILRPYLFNTRSTGMTRNNTYMSDKGQEALVDRLSDMLSGSSVSSHPAKSTHAFDSLERRGDNIGRARPPRPQSERKILVQEFSIAKLAIRLLIHSSVRHEEDHIDKSSEAAVQRQQDELVSRLQEMDRRLRMLRYSPEAFTEGGFGSPQYPTYQSLPYHERRESELALNTSIMDVLNDYRRGQSPLQVMLGKICFNLLASPTPPNTETYNLLVIYFSRFKESNLVKMVLNSFDESHMRPNERSVSSRLKFYTVTNNKFGFKDYLAKLDGLKGGTALARPGIKVSAGNDRLVARGGKIFQKAPRNQIVFGALINGACKFFGLEKALHWYERMIEEGWSANVEILTTLLRHCANTENWEAGRLVWKSLQAFNAKASSPLSDEQQRIDDFAYYWMLKLCKACSETQEYQRILREAIANGFSHKRVVHSPVMDKTARYKLRKQQNLRVSIGEAANPARAIEAIESSELPEQEEVAPQVSSPRHFRSEEAYHDIDYEEHRRPVYMASAC
ncbi:hypothetical protein L228DRAFT_251053 [Xylona heveae TC161]|uniref:Pentatricopeptide repeat protein n=1 Tax=Xylona heveae (strain CBS 132557 / TC161) TaxID=1328760 RepID=A0A164ZSN8_XYLHT|nr:hypothetical protein L228DRAFT_251053 [Xylona heveae TC161]KZF19459.1 hypothetical protein L228DRAFT_251053 [Xylona heveae TC161]